MKKILALILAAVMLFALCACGSKTEAPAAAAAEPAPAAEEPAAAAEPAAEAPAAEVVTEVSAENPVVNLNGEFDASAVNGSILLTSVGQSGDVSMMEAIFKKIGVAYEIDALATTDSLDGVGCVIAVVGASQKGLGAAGIKIEDELSRAQEIMSYCNDNNIPVILAHVGGASRTGGSSDQLINAVLEGGASYVLVVADGDVDGIFSNYCAANSIPLTLIKSLANAVEPMTEIFG